MNVNIHANQDVEYYELCADKIEEAKFSGSLGGIDEQAMLMFRTACLVAIRTMDEGDALRVEDAYLRVKSTGAFGRLEIKSMSYILESGEEVFLEEPKDPLEIYPVLAEA